MPASSFPAANNLAMIERPWAEPLNVAAGLQGRPGLLCLLSGGGGRARWSYVMAEPVSLDRIDRCASEPFERLRALLGPVSAAGEDCPPFTGGVAGLAAYDLAAPQGDQGADDQAWPDLILARYEAVLAFDHRHRRVLAIGRGADGDAARQRAQQTEGWLESARAPRALSKILAERFEAERPDATYMAAVRDVTGRIAAGEIFQANIARAWSGLLTEGAEPLDFFSRLAAISPAPHAAFWDLGDRALVSNSPETFLTVRDGVVTARPIKGTRPKSPEAARDDSMKAELLASAKDRAENLMIVDLMRNDLSRVCEAGSVTVPELFAVESYPNVHHLVSTVQGRMRNCVDVADLMAAAFPPGSITGAPKHQAMTVIARHETARGPWCGSLFLAGFDGGLDSSVLIRTASLKREGRRWALRTLAGAGIVADSDPAAELAETDAKIAAIREALTTCDDLP